MNNHITEAGLLLQQVELHLRSSIFSIIWSLEDGIEEDRLIKIKDRLRKVHCDLKNAIAAIEREKIDRETPENCYVI